MAGQALPLWPAVCSDKGAHSAHAPACTPRRPCVRVLSMWWSGATPQPSPTPHPPPHNPCWPAYIGPPASAPSPSGRGTSSTTTLGQYVSTAGALLLCSVLLPDQMPHFVPALALPGAACVAAHVMAPKLWRDGREGGRRRQALQRAAASGTCLLQRLLGKALSAQPELPASRLPALLFVRPHALPVPAATHASPPCRCCTLRHVPRDAHPHPPTPQPHRPRKGGRRPSPPIHVFQIIGVLRSTLLHPPRCATMLRCPGCRPGPWCVVAVPSALLSLAGHAWRALHTSSHSAVEAALGLMAVAMQYSQLARDCETGRVALGAWHVVRLLACRGGPGAELCVGVRGMSPHAFHRVLPVRQAGQRADASQGLT